MGVVVFVRDSLNSWKKTGKFGNLLSFSCFGAYEKEKCENLGWDGVVGCRAERLLHKVYLCGPKTL